MDQSILALVFLGGVLIAAFAGITYFYHQSKEKRSLVSSGATRQSKHEDKIGRNEPCPCGSGKKYKQCCGKKG